MSIFDGKRLTNETFKLDVERMRRGWYSDKYFENINRMLTVLSAEGYTFSGKHHNLHGEHSPENIPAGDIEVEMQWFTRRPGTLRYWPGMTRCTLPEMGTCWMVLPGGTQRGHSPPEYRRHGRLSGGAG